MKPTAVKKKKALANQGPNKRVAEGHLIHGLFLCPVVRVSYRHRFLGTKQMQLTCCGGEGGGNNTKPQCFSPLCSWRCLLLLFGNLAASKPL